MARFEQLLGPVLVQSDCKSEVATSEALAGKSAVAIYFSAHWCPPCRMFTPELAKRYEGLRSAGKDFEIVFVSSDQDGKAFDSYLSTMPWLAVPFKARDIKQRLGRKFSVSGIPTLVILDSSGELITEEGRDFIESPSYVENFPYLPKPVNDLGDSISGINTSASLLVLMEWSSEAERNAVTAALYEVAEAEKQKPNEEQAVQKFFTGTAGGPLSQIRRLCKLPKGRHAHATTAHDSTKGGWGCDGCGVHGHDRRYRCSEGCDFDYCGECYDEVEAQREDGKSHRPIMLIVDVPNTCSYMSEPSDKGELTPDTIRAFLDAFKNKKLSPTPFPEE